MPAKRKSAATHRAQGTFRADRHRDAGVGLQPMDTTPPEHMSERQQAVWHELCAAAEPFLARSDRFAVELATGLLVKMRSGSAKAAELGHLLTLMRKLGLSPDGRQQLDPVQLDEATNPFDDL